MSRHKDRPQTRQWEPVVRFADKEAPSSKCWPWDSNPVSCPLPWRHRHTDFMGLVVHWHDEEGFSLPMGPWWKLTVELSRPAIARWGARWRKSSGRCERRCCTERLSWQAWFTVWGCYSSRWVELADSQQVGMAAVHASSLSPAPTTKSAGQEDSSVLAKRRQRVTNPAKIFLVVYSHTGLPWAKVSTKAGFGAEREAVEEREHDPCSFWW